jgi:lysophospholipase L1-like esterase
MKKIYILGLMAALFASCKPNLKPEKPSAGHDVDFSRYVAVGNSLTAGYADGSLYRTGQQNSYPAILAEQLKLVGGGEFRQPLLPGDYGYPNPRMVLSMYRGYCDTAATLTPRPFTGALDTIGSSINQYKESGPFNNTGIPGIRVIDYLFPGYANYNPYAKRMFVAVGSRPIDEVVLAQPSFFTLWVGANDVLGYATAGGDQAPQNAAGTTNITNPIIFDIAYDSVLTRLKRNGAQGVCINIPDITSIPFFTTIKANGLVLSKNDANLLNNAYNALAGFIRFEAGNNYFIIEDTTIPTKFRHIKDGEYILLADNSGTISLSDSIKCAGWGTKKPIPGRYVLTADEVSKIKSATSTFNAVIATHAAKENLAVVDMYSYMGSLQSGITYNGVTFTPQFVSGGAFSLDGVHLTPRGYALVANQIIMTINSKYGATIPLVDVNKYRGIQFP